MVKMSKIALSSRFKKRILAVSSKFLEIGSQPVAQYYSYFRPFYILAYNASRRGAGTQVTSSTAERSPFPKKTEWRVESEEWRVELNALDKGSGCSHSGHRYCLLPTAYCL